MKKWSSKTYEKKEHFARLTLFFPGNFLKNVFFPLISILLFRLIVGISD